MGDFSRPSDWEPPDIERFLRKDPFFDNVFKLYHSNRYLEALESLHDARITTDAIQANLQQIAASDIPESAVHEVNSYVEKLIDQMEESVMIEGRQLFAGGYGASSRRYFVAVARLNRASRLQAQTFLGSLDNPTFVPSPASLTGASASSHAKIRGHAGTPAAARTNRLSLSDRRKARWRRNGYCL